MIILTDTQKTFHKIHDSFIKKRTQNPRNRSKLPQHNKMQYMKNPECTSSSVVRD